MAGALVQRIQEKTIKEKILESLNAQQRLPVQDYMGASIVLAGAGAGKTKTIVSRTAYMIADGIDPRSILLFTFTHKGADEIRARVMKSIGEDAEYITVGTYHSFCAKLLRRYVEVMDIWTRNFSIYDSEDSLAAMKKILKQAKADEHEYKPSSVLKVISHWKERMLGPTDAMSDAGNNEWKKNSAEFYRQYSLMLRADNAMDFDDLIFYVIRLFEGYPDILEAVNSRYKFIVADESQDSSPRDLELIYYLGGSDMNVCLVGDDYQAIYGFRGSDINAFFDFVDAYGLKKFYLGRNYRSTKTIVEAAQKVIAHNQKQFEKHLFTTNEEGAPIVSFTLPDQRREALRVVQIVKALKKKGVNYSDIAVLYRANYLSRRIEDAFIANNIRYWMRSGTPFYARKEVKDIMAYLKLVINPSDQMAFERAIKVPKRNVGEASLTKITDCFYYGEYDIMSIRDMKTVVEESNCCGTKGKAKKGLQNFIAILSSLSEERERNASPSEMIESAISLTAYLPYLQKDDEDTFEERKANLEELITVASSYNSLEEFVGDMTVNESGADDESDDADRVNMMTVHGSKGLEFKAVIVIGCNQDIFPHIMSIRTGNLDEERRLFYVAMTRAKKLLFLTRPECVEVRGTTIPQQPSCFLKEIEPQYIRQL